MIKLTFLIVLVALALSGCAAPQNDSITCTLEYAPVCGEDGVTYGNDCMADASGIPIAYEGECEESFACIEIYQPVCGEDGVTYSNSCYAEVAGVAIASEGECLDVSSVDLQLEILGDGLDPDNLVGPANTDLKILVTNTASEERLLSFPQYDIHETIDADTQYILELPAKPRGVYSMEISYSRVGTLQLR